MQDYIVIGYSPYDEDCAQVGQENYTTQAIKECRALINQMRRVHGEEPAETSLRTESFPHDFGTYHEVVCYYNPDDEESCTYAFMCEAGLPAKWDVEARQELGLLPEPTTLTIRFSSLSLDQAQLSDWIDSTFEMLDMGDISYEAA